MTRMRLNKLELSKLLGISANTVNQWCTKELPRFKEKGRIYFYVDDLIPWLSEHNMNPKYIYTLTAKSVPVNDSDPENPEDLKSILDRLRGIEAWAYKQYKSANMDQKAFWMKEHRDASEQLRKYEKDWAMIQQSMGAVISNEDHEKTIKSICTEIRQRMENLPAYAAPLCEKMPVEMVFEILSKEVQKILKALNDG